MADTDTIGNLRDEQRREVESYERQRRRLADDPFRPTYHFSPPGGILHDPNGALYWNGRYHLFYQFRPPAFPDDRPWHESMHWGHAVSEDLVHWRDLPIALGPDTGPEDSCYSGQALVEDDRVVLMYHGPGAGNSIATADGSLLVDWEKSAHNPVIPTGEDEEYRVFDPEIFELDGTYYSLSGAYTGEQYVDSSPAVYLFSSEDLTEWEYEHPFLQDERFTGPGEDATVPNLIEIDDRHVLLCFSHHRGAHYYVGDLDTETMRFEPSAHGRLTHAPSTHEGYIGDLDAGNLHAPSVLETPDGRHVAFFNVNVGASRDGWGELVSLPREIGLDEQDRLTVEPIAEVEQLRTENQRYDPGTISPGEEIVLSESSGRALEVSATIDPGSAGRIGVSMFRAPDRTEVTDVNYYQDVDCLGIDTRDASLFSDSTTQPPEQGRLALGDDELLDVRVFVDRSIVEVFANGRRTLTARAYPERADSTGLSVFADRGSATVEQFDVWKMDSTWDDVHQ